jgi:hypothetical protein
MIAGILLLAGISYLAVFGRALAQPENHVRIFFSLPQVIAGKAVAIGGGKYFSKSPALFIGEMETQGFKFSEQMGSGYFFAKDGENYLSTGRMYSSHFMVFDAPVKR